MDRDPGLAARTGIAEGDDPAHRQRVHEAPVRGRERYLHCYSQPVL